MSDNNTCGVSTEQMVAAYKELVDLCKQANAALEIMMANVSWWVRDIAAKLERQHELKTALRWAAVYNRPLYERRQRTKKLRIRKKYEKRILAWYRAEGVGGPRGDDGYGSTGEVMQYVGDRPYHPA